MTEATNPEDEEYGLERLEAALRAHLAEPLPDLLDGLEHDLDAFTRGVPYADDRTFVLVRRLPAGAVAKT